MGKCRCLRRALIVVVVILLGGLGGADPKPGDKPTGPFSPKEELATFRLLKGFRMELVACEPEVVDPVAFAFDFDGKLFVAEMRGYPNGGVATGEVSSGRVKLLEDRDNDGFFEKSTIFADGLRLPTAVFPYRGGVIVANSPEIIFLKDKDGDGKADEKRVLYEGFDLSNIQQLVSSFQWGLDNWVYACCGGRGGTIRSVEKKDAPPVVLRGRGIRFRPAEPGSLEPMSGGGQFGLTADDWQHWFTSTNSQHLKQIVLPDHYLRRNPYLPVSAVTINIPDHGAACKVYRISPFEAWRVERTKRRKGGANAKRYSPTELVPGGFITSACSPLVYRGDLFPKEYYGQVFVCDPANNLIHRDVLKRRGAVFVAQRADADCEFLASTDNWFRPVATMVGPDGALYIADFYREVIETPLSLPDDIKAKLNLQSRNRGRIWRVVPDSLPVRRRFDWPRLSSAKTESLVPLLDHANAWYRHAAQQLLVDRQDKSAAEALRKLAASGTTPQGRAHALWTLHGLNALDEATLVAALADKHPEVRAQAVRMSEDKLATSAAVRAKVTRLTDDESFEVRFQLAFSLGASDAAEASEALARLIRSDWHNRWMQTAILSSAAKIAPDLLASLLNKEKISELPDASRHELVRRLAAIVGAEGDDRRLAKTMKLLGNGSDALQAAILEGLGTGLQNSKRSLKQLWEKPPDELRPVVVQARAIFAQAAKVAANPKTSLAARLDAVRLLGYGPYELASQAFRALLVPESPAEVQRAVIRSLALHDHPQVGQILLAHWPSYSPALRREVVEAVFARTDRLKYFLDAVEKKEILLGQLEPARRLQLEKHPQAEIRRRARKLLAGKASPSRQKVIDAYRAALELKGSAQRGKEVFKKNCAVCHRLEDVGVQVGADLLAALPNKTPEALLIDILDPSREVDPRFINYIVVTKAGKQLTGIIAEESATSVTIRRAEKAEDVVLRTQIDEIIATAKSIMPEELEKQLSQQDVADVIAYLLSVRGKAKK
ncbi:MAG: cytochrome c [Gemmatales bacterium]|nr:MAG: cytochrome c [Gemmatales bacterium]